MSTFKITGSNRNVEGESDNCIGKQHRGGELTIIPQIKNQDHKQRLRVVPKLKIGGLTAKVEFHIDATCCLF